MSSSSLTAAWVVTGSALLMLAGCTSPTPDSPTDSNSATAPAQWSYDTDAADGPANWGSLPGYGECGPNDRRQSPIAIDRGTAIDVDRAAPTVRFRQAAATMTNNGHSVEADIEEGGELLNQGAEYELANVHFHAPSEHELDGREFPLEIHFVSKNESGAAVVGLLVEQGLPAPDWESFIAGLRQVPQPGNQAEAELPVPELLPARFRAFEYAGGLTTPPCSPIVAWSVVSEPMTMSADQIAAFTDVYSDDDRPVQPLNDRVVELTTRN